MRLCQNGLKFLSILYFNQLLSIKFEIKMPCFALFLVNTAIIYLNMSIGAQSTLSLEAIKIFFFWIKCNFENIRTLYKAEYTHQYKTYRSIKTTSKLTSCCSLLSKYNVEDENRLIE